MSYGQKHREEVNNVELARLLRQRGLVAAPESILSSSTGRKLPDIIVDFRGLRVVLEGKIYTGKGSRDEASTQASERVEQGIAHMGIAVLYPKESASCPHGDLPDLLAKCGLEIQIHTEVGATDWIPTTLHGLGEKLNRAYEGLVRDDVVVRALDILENAISDASGVFMNIPSAPEKLV